MEKLSYLKKYAAAVALVDFETLPPATREALPLFWREALAEINTVQRKEILLREWDKYSYQFAATTSYLKEHLEDVELMEQNGSYSLLYTVRNKAGNSIYYEGKNPLTKQIPAEIKKLWHKIPAAFTDVYDHFHNGWVYFASQSNGLSPIEDAIVLGEMDWGILDEIDVHTLPFQLNNCMGFFNNGMGDYVAIDLERKDESNGFIWWHNKAPKLHIEAWPVIDEWTKIGMEK